MLSGFVLILVVVAAAAVAPRPRDNCPSPSDFNNTSGLAVVFRDNPDVSLWLNVGTDSNTGMASSPILPLDMSFTIKVGRS